MRAFNTADLFEQMVVALVASTIPIPGDDSIREYLRPLAGYKMPRQVVAVDQIRYTPQGKPDLAWADAAASHGDDR